MKLLTDAILKKLKKVFFFKEVQELRYRKTSVQISGFSIVLELHQMSTLEEVGRQRMHKIATGCFILFCCSVLRASNYFQTEVILEKH